MDKVVTIKLPAELVDKIRQVADQQGISVSEWFEIIVLKEIEP